jgi:hypothetical protein
MSDYTANCRPVLSSERAPYRHKTADFTQQHSDRKSNLVASPKRVLDTKTYWLTVSRKVTSPHLTMYSILNCHNVSRHTKYYLGCYGSKWFSMAMQRFSERSLQWYSKCYCVASVTIIIILKGAKTIHCSTAWTMDTLYTRNYKYFRSNRHTKYHCKALFEAHSTLNFNSRQNWLK